MSALPNPQSTIAIILGASEFDDMPHLSSPAFKQSAKRFYEYLTEKDKLNIPPDNVLDLFDSKDVSITIDRKVGSFLKARVEAPASTETSIEDLIVYYVGHGGFSDDGKDEYYLALRSITDDNKCGSSYAIKWLAKKLKEYALDIRKYVILDCCFSAEAYKAFQSTGPVTVAVTQTQEEFPRKGTALLCASGPRTPAKAPPGATYTMFSGAFLDVLERGDKEEPEVLSLLTVAERTRRLIKDRYKDDAVRPEVHSPEQSQGSVAAVPLFPNQALRPTAMESRLHAAEEAIQAVSAGQGALKESVAAVDQTLKTLTGQLEILQKRPPPEETRAPGQGDQEKWEHGMPRAEWLLIPSEVKADIVKMERAKRDALVWWLVTGVVGIAILVSAFLPWTQTFPLRTQANILLSLIGIQTLFFVPTGAAFIRRFRTQTPGMEPEPAYVGRSTEWRHFSAVVELQDFVALRVLGIDMDRRRIVAALITIVVTLTYGLVFYFPLAQAAAK